MKTILSSDAGGFLTALTWSACEDFPWRDIPPEDFSQEIAEWVNSFCQGFRDFLGRLGIEIPDTDRSFGGNVYFSLSGHGVGFWDDSETEFLQPHLETYAGGRYRFEHLDFAKDRKTGKWDLSFMARYLPYYRERTFRAPGGPVPRLNVPQVRDWGEPGDLGTHGRMNAYATRTVSLSWIVKRTKHVAKWRISAHPEIAGQPDRGPGDLIPHILTVTLVDGRDFVAGFPSLGDLIRFAKMRNLARFPGPYPI